MNGATLIGQSNVRSVRKRILSGLCGAASVEEPNVNDTAQNPTRLMKNRKKIWYY
jgi:hypothetical protein